MRTTGQAGFSVVNIIVGVILTLSSIIMLTDPSTLPGPFFAFPLGVAWLIVGVMAMSKVRKARAAGQAVQSPLLVVNLVFFVLSCLILLASVLLPVIAPLL